MKRFDSDPQYFVESLVLKDAQKRFGECAAAHQKEWLSVLAPTFLALAAGRKPPVQRVWLEGTKGSAKDTILAALVLWLMACTRRPLFAQVGAVDQRQASELEKAARTWMHCNGKMVVCKENQSRLEDLVVVHNCSIKSKSGLGECEIISADIAGGHGARPDLLIINELHAITRWEFVETHMDNADKVADGAVIIATNAGFQETKPWEWREIFIKDPNWKFLIYAAPPPWMEPGRLKEAERRNAGTRFRRLWWGEWVGSGMGDAFDPDDLDRISKNPVPTLEREKGWVYAAGVDASVVHDDTAIVVCAKHVGYAAEFEEAPRNRLLQWMDDEYSGYATEDTERIIKEKGKDGTGDIRLVHVKIWKPRNNVTGRIDFDELANEIVRLHRLLHLSAVHFDSYQTEYLVQLLKKQGINALAVGQSNERQEAMAEEIFTAIQNDQLRLYNQPQLLADMGNAQLKESANRYKLVSPKNNKGEGTRHGDTLSALLNAVYALKPFAKAQESSVGRPLLCWP